MCSEILWSEYHNNNRNCNTHQRSCHLMPNVTHTRTHSGNTIQNNICNSFMEQSVANVNCGANHSDNHNHYESQCMSTNNLSQALQPLWWSSCAHMSTCSPQCRPSSPSSPTSPSSPCPQSSPHASPNISFNSNGETHAHQHHQQLHQQNHHQNHAQNDNQTIPQYYDHLIHSQEFLPLCDLLFNVISLAAYFCNIVFDSIIAYTFYLQSNTFWFIVILSLILCSSVISQILSVFWYTIRTKPKTDNLFKFQGICVLTINVLLLGVFWRYFKLFIPVDLSSVKHEVRDLCVLRMVHAFCEAAPILIIQVYFILLKPSVHYIDELHIISIFLSLFCVCWALASFSKNVRNKNIHKLVLTWLGVIFQFFWRLGTISSRVIALTVYATIYNYWVIVVIILHWFSMLLWLLSPKNLFYGEKMSTIKKVCYSCLIAWVYIFCFINMHEENCRNKMIAFYSIMFLENTLLLSICIVLNNGINPWFQTISVLLVWGGFALGMLFMFVYYKFFHIRHMKHSLLAAHYDPMEFTSSYCPEHGNHQHYNDAIHSNSALNGRQSQSNASSERKLPISGINCAHNGVITGIPGVFNCRLNPALKRKKKMPSSFIPPPLPTTLNTIASAQSTNNLGSVQSNKSVAKTTKPSTIPSASAFWKKSGIGNGFLNSHSISPSISSSPLTLPAKHPFSATIAPSPVTSTFTDLHLRGNKPIITPSSQTPPINKENNTNQNSISKVNIQQKLQEKKQQQFMRLKKIEEEIKQGKLKPHKESPTHMHRAIAPQAKKQPWANSSNSTNSNASNPTFVPLGNNGIHNYYYHPVYRRIKLRSQTPEVLLSPHYLDNSRIYYDYPSCVLPPQESRLLKVPLEGSAEEEEDNYCLDGDKPSNNVEFGSKAKPKRKARNNYQNAFTSDIDSQVSLPRSYTLPREFQYSRANGVTVGNGNVINGVNGEGVGSVWKPRVRKPLSNGHFQANVDSNSSNDGDVDSDINQHDYDVCAVPKIIRGPVHNVKTPAAVPIRARDHDNWCKRHETSL